MCVVNWLRELAFSYERYGVSNEEGETIDARKHEFVFMQDIKECANGYCLVSCEVKIVSQSTGSAVYRIFEENSQG